MPPPSDLEGFLVYARSFELAYWSDGWDALAPLFAEDARHVVHAAAPLGANDAGRAAVIAGLRASVHAIDRRFEVRIPEVIEGPAVTPDGIWMRFSLALRSQGLPELRIEGEHLARWAGGRIVLLEETLAPEAGEKVAAFLAQHGARLRAPGASATPPADPRDARDLDAAVARSLVRGYAAAKSRQDVSAALAVCSEDFVLETVSLGLRARDRKQAEHQLALFFHAFPDYSVALEGLASVEGAVAGWGRARMSWRGAFAGLAPSGRSAELPVFCVFACAQGALRGERFFFDLASLCEQLGLPLADLRAKLAAIRDREAAVDA